MRSRNLNPSWSGVLTGGANEIRVKRRGAKPHIYGLGDRDQTDKWRTVLRRLYPGLYCEKNF